MTETLPSCEPVAILELPAYKTELSAYKTAPSKPSAYRSHSPSTKALLVCCVFLAAVVLLSLVTYLPQLGFYSDDWGFLALLKNSPDQSFTGLFRSLNTDHNVRIRPVQVAAWVFLYQLSGTSPLGFHLCNAMLLVSMALLLFALLLELGQPLLIAVSVPAIYTLLPHYSTDRFWPAAIQADISMASYFLSFYAALRTLRSRWLWLAVAVFFTVISALAYEVVVPLFAITMVEVLRRGKNHTRARIVAASTALAVFACYVFKVSVNQRHVMTPGTFRAHAIWLFHESLFVNFYQLGLAYPRVVLKAAMLHSGFAAYITAMLTAAIVFACVLWSLKHRPRVIAQTPWKRLTVYGLVVFGLGYAVFFLTDQVGFHKTGVDNRVSIAAALGIALSALGLIGWISATMARRAQRITMALLVSLLCASGSFINQVLAGYWVQGYREESAIMQHLDHHHLSLKPGSVLLMDGVCPYDGPVPILESWWEDAGIAQLLFRQSNLAGDAISPRIQIGERALTTYIYGEAKSYAYGDRFVIYNVTLDRAFHIQSATEMNQYLKTYRNFSNTYRNCPGRPGEGVAVF